MFQVDDVYTFKVFSFLGDVFCFRKIIPFEGSSLAGMFLTYGRTGETRTRQGLSYGRPFYPYGRPYTYELPAVGVCGARKL